MSDYDIILLIIGIAVVIFAIAFMLYNVKDANEFIYKAEQMAKQAKEELERREEGEQE